MRSNSYLPRFCLLTSLYINMTVLDLKHFVSTTATYSCKDRYLKVTLLIQARFYPSSCVVGQSWIQRGETQSELMKREECRPSCVSNFEKLISCASLELR